MDIDEMVDQFLGVSTSFSPPSKMTAPLYQPQQQQFAGSSAAPPQSVSFVSNAKKLFNSSSAANTDQQQQQQKALSRGGSSTAMMMEEFVPSSTIVDGGHLSPNSHTKKNRSSIGKGGGASPLPFVTSSGRRRGGGADGSSSMEQDPTLRRIQLWAERKDAKLTQLMYDQLQRERDECPFEPQRDFAVTPSGSSVPRGGDGSAGSSMRSFSPNRLYADNKAWGYDAFVDRLLTARATKAEQDEEDKRRTGHYVGQRWKGGMTVPEPFELGRTPCRGTGGRHEKSPYDEYAPMLREQLMCLAANTVEPPSIPKGLYSSPCSQVIVESNRLGFQNK